MPLVIGVDGCKRGWVAVAVEAGRFRDATLLQSFVEVVESFEAATVIAVDIPIGLPTHRPRAADAAARKFIGPRAPSVFTTPPRAALVAATFKDATATAHRLFGRGISQQSYALRHKIFEVESVAHGDRRIVEVHPEVSFRALANRPLSASKRTWNGIMERRGLLAQAGLNIPTTLGGAGLTAADDILDATAAAWTAMRIDADQARSLPDPPERGPGGRPVAIWY